MGAVEDPRKTKQLANEVEATNFPTCHLALLNCQPSPVATSVLLISLTFVRFSVVFNRGCRRIRDKSVVGGNDVSNKAKIEKAKLSSHCHTAAYRGFRIVVHGGVPTT